MHKAGMFVIGNCCGNSKFDEEIQDFDGFFSPQGLLQEGFRVSLSHKSINLRN